MEAVIIVIIIVVVWYFSAVIKSTVSTVENVLTDANVVATSKSNNWKLDQLVSDAEARKTIHNKAKKLKDVPTAEDIEALLDGSQAKK